MSNSMFYVTRQITILPVDESVNEHPIKIETKKLEDTMSYIPPVKEVEFDWSESLGNIISKVEAGECQAELAYLTLHEVPGLEIYYDVKTGFATVHYNGFQIRGHLLAARKYKVVIMHTEYIPTLCDMMDKPFDEVIKYADALNNRRSIHKSQKG